MKGMFVSLPPGVKQEKLGYFIANYFAAVLKFKK